MNINNSKTESFYNYLGFHQRFNNIVKVATTGLETLRRLVNVSNGDKLLGILVDSNNNPWGTGKRFPDTNLVINETLKGIFQSLLIESLSAFDWYTTGVISELCQFSNKMREKKFIHAHADSLYKPTKPVEYLKCCVAYAIQYSNNNRLSTRLTKMKDDLLIDSKEYDKLLTLFHYFRIVRNCFAHYNGRIDKELDELLSREEFKESYSYWSKKSAKKSPSLPTGRQGEIIEFSNLNCIMSSAVCFEIAKIINKKAIEILGEEGIISMAAFHSLLSTNHDFRGSGHKVAEAAIANFLSTRYSVKGVKKEILAKPLKKLGIWSHCYKRFEILYCGDTLRLS